MSEIDVIYPQCGVCGFDCWEDRRYVHKSCIKELKTKEAADFRREQEGGTETKMELKTLQKLCHEIATEKGWHDRDNPVSEMVANIHREVSELWEWYRKGDGPSDHIPNFTGTEEEAADIIIRVLDSAEEYEWDVIGAIEAKCEYNKTRSYRHGNKKA